LWWDITLDQKGEELLILVRSQSIKFFAGGFGPALSGFSKKAPSQKHPKSFQSAALRSWAFPSATWKRDDKAPSQKTSTKEMEAILRHTSAAAGEFVAMTTPWRITDFLVKKQSKRQVW
jgi:hypothetical protein